jgi:catalase
MISYQSKTEFSEVEKLAQDAHVWYKEKNFRPSHGNTLTRYVPPTKFYNV